MNKISVQKNTREHEKDIFEVHKCPQCGMKDEFNMDYDKFLCRNCGKATTADVKTCYEGKNYD